MLQDDSSDSSKAIPAIGDNSLRDRSATIRNILNPDGNFPEPSAAWITWMQEEQGLSKATRTLYKYCITLYLGFVSHEVPNSPSASLWYVWDYTLAKRFFAKLKIASNPSSVNNYHCALANVRLYMRLCGNRPDDYLVISERFQHLAKTSQKDRSAYIQKSKEGCSKSTNLLRKVYLNIYHSESKWLRMQQIFSRLQSGGPNVTPEELSFLNGCLGFVLLCSNGFRTGNIDPLESEPMAKSLAQALGEFRHNFPEDDVNDAPRVLDRIKSFSSRHPGANRHQDGKARRCCGTSGARSRSPPTVSPLCPRKPAISSENVQVLLQF